MSKIVETQLTTEHLKRSNGVKCIKAICEAVWNSLDADANNVSLHIKKEDQFFGETIVGLEIKDDGHGLPYEKIDEALTKYGVSPKTYNNLSPSGRQYHGKLGEGRFTYFSIGKSVVWLSNYFDSNRTLNQIKIKFSDTSTSIVVEDPVALKEGKQGLTLEIYNLDDASSKYLSNVETITKDLVKEFAPYVLSFENIKIRVQDKEINFNDAIELIKKFDKTIDNKKFKLEIISWKDIKSGEYYLLGNGNACLFSDSLKGIPSNISVYISSPFFDELKQSGELEMLPMNDKWEDISKFVFESLSNFSSEHKTEANIRFIGDLKESGVYPYEDVPQDIKEESSKKVFDVIAVKLNEISPGIKTANKETRKLTYKLIKTAIEDNPSSLRKVLAEVYKLPKEKLDEFALLLDKMSLSAMVSTLKEVENRLSFLKELKEIVYKEDGKYVKERTQFQPLLLSQLWIFGDRYVYGVDDVNLRNVLKEFANQLGIENFELTEEDMNNTDLNKIPDIVLWRKVRYGDCFENLVVEIKRPHKTIGMDEVNQIITYRNTIVNHPSFSQGKNKWRFILVGKDLDEYAKSMVESNPDGIISYRNSKLEIISWSDLIDRNELKYQFFEDETKVSFTETNVKNALDNRWKELFEIGSIKDIPTSK